jgi:cation:H+ antiporter
MLLWAHFLISAAFVIAAGTVIGRISGELGDRLGLGRAWAGAVLLSFATTLPELISTLTVTIRGNGAMAVGGILGSVLFNLFIIVIVDLADRDPIYHRLSLNHVFTGVLGTILLAIVIMGLSFGALSPKGMAVPWRIGSIGLPALAIIGFYCAGQAMLFGLAKSSRDDSSMKVATRFDKLSLGKLIAIYAGVAAVIIAAAYNLGVSAENLAESYSLGATFAGATLLGIVTSLPEVTNAVTCARSKDFDLAIGNIFGANAFVIVVLAVADFFAVQGSLFVSDSSAGTVSTIAMAALAIVMQGVALGALSSHSMHRVWRLGTASVALAALYFLSLYLSYRFSPVVH